MPDAAADLTARVVVMARRVHATCAPVLDAPATGWLEQAIDDLARTGDAAGGESGPTPFDRLVRRLGLAPFEEDLLVLAGLPEEHELLAAVVRRLHPFGLAVATPALAVAVLCNGTHRARVRSSLEAGPLARAGLLRSDDTLPFWDRPLRPAAGIWAALAGAPCLPPEPRPLPVPATAGLGAWLADDHDAAAAARACAGERPLVVVVTAPDALDAAARAAAVVERATGSAVLAAASSLASDADAQLWGLHALARGLVPVVVADTDGRACPLPGHPGPVVVAATPATQITADDRPVLHVRTAPLALDERRALWRQLLPATTDADSGTLAGLLRVEPHRAVQAVADLANAAALNGGGPPATDPAAVAAAVRARMGLQLPPSVRLVEPAAGWDRLVLTEDRLAQLREATSRASHQSRVLLDWGLGHGRRGAGGTRLLFAGSPGTGKTLAAEVIAYELGLDLLVVDLAALVSKWLGETEKNLATVFDVAEAAQAVLLFDEADALFARRTEVSDAHSRWANLETAYLLGRLEAFDGVVVLATNLRQNLDPAFVRRLEFVVEFDEPGRDERQRLWAAHLPPTAPLAPDVDLAQLARLYQVPGGVIRNATLAAAFAAAGDGGPIGQQDLVAAVRREYEKAGRSFPGAPRGLGEPTTATREAELCPRT